jgi:ribose 5-phosphate isomerase A
MEWTGNSSLFWNSEIANLEAKRKAGRQIAERIQPGQIIGIGSGSTAYVAIQEIARRKQQQKLDFAGIPTSMEARLACARHGIPCTTLQEHRPDWAFDGADEVDPDGNMIKGRGGAFFVEKLVDGAASELFILIDRSKFVPRLGTKFPIPVEVYPPAVRHVEAMIRDLGAREIITRTGSGKDGPVITEQGNLILDVRFDAIAAGTEKDLKSLCGVIETGLFWGFHPTLIAAD